MKTGYYANKPWKVIFFQLISLLVSASASSQSTDTASNLPSGSGDTTFKVSSGQGNSMSPLKKLTSDLTKMLVERRQYVQLSFDKRKIRQRIEKDSPVYQLPGGDSRILLFGLPAYENDYSLTIRSLVHGFAFSKYHIFSPTGVFLDSSFRPTHLLSEKQFVIENPTNYKALNIKAEVPMDSERKTDRYLLIFTMNNHERLATYNDPGFITGLVNYPVERSPDGRLEVQIHLR